MNTPSIDPHKQRAAELFGVPYEEVTAEQRSYAKQYMYRELYSAGPTTFVAALKRLSTVHSTINKEK